MPFEAFLGISVSRSTIPIDPINTLANTQNAGETFWAGAMFLSALCLASIGVQWFRQLDRETRQEDRRVQAQAAATRTRAEQLGVTGLREGWTVPWWRLAQLEAQQRRHPQPAHSPSESPAADPPIQDVADAERPSAETADPKTQESSTFAENDRAFDAS